MFENVLASVRIGAAAVDTRLDQSVVAPGETFSAQVVVDGGEVDQDIEGIELELKTRREVEDARRPYEIDSYHVTDSFTIHEDEREVFDVEWRLHPETPVTTVDARYNRAEVWIDTDLAIDRAIDADDTDYLDVGPTAPVEAMLDAVAAAGYSLHEVTVDDDRIGVNDRRSDLPLDQEFVFRPDGSAGFTEVEVHFLPDDGATDVLLEFDRSHRSESFESLRIDHDDFDADSLSRRFREIAQRI
ncbi:MAG: sporulation protein [Haloarculaceae archaeon]